MTKLIEETNLLPNNYKGATLLWAAILNKPALTCTLKINFALDAKKIEC